MAAVRVVAPAPETDVQSDAYLYWLRDLLWPARVERYGGALLVSGAPAIEHQDVWGRLYAWLLAWADGVAWGADPGGAPRGEVFQASELRLEGAGIPRPERGRAPDNGLPDLALRRADNPLSRVVPSAPGSRGRAGYLEGRPDLLVEVLSPGTAEHDRTTKRRAFAAAGVPHYWLVDWRRRRVAVLTRPVGGDYTAEATVALAEVRWPPEDPDAPRWGDHPHFPRG
jgi:Uma2 family endonuclease